jgi:hypothetical protein
MPELNYEQLKLYAEMKEKQFVELEMEYQAQRKMLIATEEFALRQQAKKIKMEERIKKLKDLLSAY